MGYFLLKQRIQKCLMNGNQIAWDQKESLVFKLYSNSAFGGTREAVGGPGTAQPFIGALRQLRTVICHDFGVLTLQMIVVCVLVVSLPFKVEFSFHEETKTLVIKMLLSHQ